MKHFFVSVDLQYDVQFLLKLAPIDVEVDCMWLLFLSCIHVSLIGEIILIILTLGMQIELSTNQNLLKVIIVVRCSYARNS